MLETTLTKIKFLIFSIVLLAAVLVLFFALRKPEEKPVLEVEIAYCGTSALMRPRRVDTSMFVMTDSLRAEMPIIEKGKELFEENCKSCHSMHERSVGPALYGIGNRRERKWIHRFVRNSRELIRSGDTTAMNLYKEYGRAEMTAFPDFTDEQIDAIIKYCSTETYCVR